ncbi:uncharacterized protein LOC142227945 [Haematobia irritans]|uniref:uncharacterized protein LOC142227945 n=1 Tax=Haematobia irritans TaxID=7368 RepID=UPI003F4F475C
MEEFISGNMSREEILNIFEQRHLPLDDMYNLTHPELVRVYKTFCLPLSQRHASQRSKRTESLLHRTPVETMDIDVAPSTSNVNMTEVHSPVGEKRRPSYEEHLIEDYQYLSRATKRIKICMS